MEGRKLRAVDGRKRVFAGLVGGRGLQRDHKIKVSGAGCDSWVVALKFNRLDIFELDDNSRLVDENERLGQWVKQPVVRFQRASHGVRFAGGNKVFRDKHLQIYRDIVR